MNCRSHSGRSRPRDNEYLSTEQKPLELEPLFSRIRRPEAHQQGSKGIVDIGPAFEELRDQLGKQPLLKSIMAIYNHAP